MASYSALTVVGGTTITSAWGNNVRSSAITTETATPGATVEGQHWARTDLDTLYRYTGSAAEAWDGYGAWTAYTPSVGGLAAIGNGTAVGGYRFVGGRAVEFWARFTVGSTTSFSAIETYMSMPFACATSGQSLPCAIDILCYDVSAVTSYVGTALDRTATDFYFGIGKADGGGSNFLRLQAFLPGTPFTPATGDVLLAAGTYETAS